MKRTVQQSVVIIAGSAALALVVNAVSPRGIPLLTPPKPVLPATEVVAFDEAKLLWEAGAALFLDARSPADYAAGHIPNALSLPAEAFDQNYPRVAPLLAPDTAIIVYCSGQQCDLSHEVMQKLRPFGYKNVRLLSDGWGVWGKAKLPAKTGDQP
jgi:rhodanese-related sulfurtransferase